MATKILTIVGYSSNYTPTFLNSVGTNNGAGDIHCNVGDIIQWTFIPKIGISKISIVYAGGTNIFSKGPSKLPNLNTWQGTVAATVVGREETYKISITPDGSTKEFPSPVNPQISVSTWNNTNKELVKRNLFAMQKFNDYVYDHSSARVDNAFLLMTEKDANPELNEGLDIFTGILNGLGSLLGPIGTAVSSILGSLLTTWATSPPPSLNTTFAKLLDLLSAINIQIDKQLAEYISDPHKYWNSPFEFQGKTETISDLIVGEFPDGKQPAFYTLIDLALINLDRAIWTYVLRRNFVITKLFGPYNPAIGKDSWYFPGESNAFPAELADQYLANNKAYFIVAGKWYPSVACTSVNRWVYYLYYLNSSNVALSNAACDYLFKNYFTNNVVNPKGLFEREEVFTSLKIQTNTNMDFIQPVGAPSKSYLRAMINGKTLGALVAREGRAAIEAKIIQKAYDDPTFYRDLEVFPRQTLENFLEVQIGETQSISIVFEKEGLFGLVIPIKNLTIPDLRRTKTDSD